MARRGKPLLVLACVVLGFLGALVVRSRPADPAARLPARYRLADLIHSEEQTTAELRREVAQLRDEVAVLRGEATARAGGVSALEVALEEVGLVAGLRPMRGAGLKVSLDDSRLDEPPPTANVNDLVIHSQDVQAVVNALWRAGAEAVAINGQRLVATSAVLCVGNTLLLNGTVHSPPYVAIAIGASRDRFEADSLVRRLHQDADTFDLRFSVEREPDLEVPAYRGAALAEYAKPAQ